MRPGGLEPPTNSLEGCCSIHLSYGRGSLRRKYYQGAAPRLAYRPTARGSYTTKGCSTKLSR